MARKEYNNKIVLNYYLKNKSKTLKEIAKHLNLNISCVSNIISNFKNNITIYRELWFCFSMDRSESLGFLYDTNKEKQVKIKNNFIENSEDFTAFELLWLEKNYKLESI